VTEVFPYDPKLVGHRLPEVVLGKGSGPDSVRMAAEEPGYLNLTADELQAPLLAVKMESLGLRRLITKQEFKLILASVLEQGQDGGKDEAQAGRAPVGQGGLRPGRRPR
jgi:hypothetical protein